MKTNKTKKTNVILRESSQCSDSQPQDLASNPFVSLEFRPFASPSHEDPRRGSIFQGLTASQLDSISLSYLQNNFDQPYFTPFLISKLNASQFIELTKKVNEILLKTEAVK